MKNIVLYTVLLFFSTSNFYFGSNIKKNTSEIVISHIEFNIHLDSLNLQKGIKFIEQMNYDSARYYLLKSAESENIPIKTESYLYLNFIETRLKNHELALTYLEQYHKNAMLLFNRALQAENAIKNREENISDIIYSIEYQNKRKLFFIIVFCLILLTIIFLLMYIRQKDLFIFTKRKKAELDDLDFTIKLKTDENKSISYNSYLLQADIFKQTSIYSEIKLLESQQKDRNTKVLTNEKQDQLQQELNRIFENFQNELNTSCAKLTSNDIKLCCLSLLPLSTYGKALCFGSTETNIIKQRKHYIKKKMTKESNNSALFYFIFSQEKIK